MWLSRWTVCFRGSIIKYSLKYNNIPLIIGRWKFQLPRYHEILEVIITAPLTTFSRNRGCDFVGAIACSRSVPLRQTGVINNDDRSCGAYKSWISVVHHHFQRKRWDPRNHGTCVLDQVDIVLKKSHPNDDDLVFWSRSSLVMCETAG